MWSVQNPANVAANRQGLKRKIVNQRWASLNRCSSRSVSNVGRSQLEPLLRSCAQILSSSYKDSAPTEQLRQRSGGCPCGRRIRFIGLTAYGACLACEAVVSRGTSLCTPKLLAALYVRTCTSSRPRARHNGESARSLALLTTASQARHAPRLAPYVDEYWQPQDSCRFERRE